MRDRAGIDASSHQTCNVSHIHQQISSHFVGNLAEFSPIENPAVSRKTADNQLGLVGHRQVADRVVIDQASLVIDAILYRVVDLAREIHRSAVGQVPTVGKAHSQNRIAGLQQRLKHRNIRAGPRVWLDVGEICAEQGLGTLNGQCLRLINKFAATVVALAGVTLGVLVGEHRTLGFQHPRTAIVLRGNQFDVLFLPNGLGTHGGPQFSVEGFNGLVIGIQILRQMGSSLIHGGFLLRETAMPSP